ncbi:hypothetical protein [Rhodoferax aquaticus]|uniref:Uncharacterized protein n=1 Tax=Rhodoferax aquaticus TaxID=2527691 RepID=A0A515EM29_9BURK|nr:hypothetical protein [Rhodoferax aquaticus]QDL53694.1 hypothetical protein EXZ61_05635 [Rhodoferax aquaticus]
MVRSAPRSGYFVRPPRRTSLSMVTAAQPRGNALLRAVLAKRALAVGLAVSPDDVQITHGCVEALPTRYA